MPSVNLTVSSSRSTSAFFYHLIAMGFFTPYAETKPHDNVCLIKADESNPDTLPKLTIVIEQKSINPRKISVTVEF
ncbi:hypothetical protein BFJ68_g17444 [Fusarium oxysporum]|uniref:Uncharacterized protein n=3 Tax=Fusarium oxysporum TaxID=5507 RepID=A0A420NSW8_FUSOX|nr:hypothetical protein BFJ65_g17106 [Fusarium oxysporum f. sp. cepae]RKK21076.1 hypothetical protein BFJ67_g17477 [Fusarium oxysporum f. sp. cepae]RKK23708.1 hypothetical protein BFJ66_g17400 [Fusarium oxysporum f. sp. cepae]RKK83352.1 hypothetical protein BFJ68_g17444 [Fusarium oxysporum]